MKATDYLDRIKRAHKLPSDYALAKMLGVSHNRVSNYRTERSSFDEEMCLKVAEALDLDPLSVMADINAQRTRSPQVRAFWQGIAKKLGRAAALYPVVVAGILTAAVAPPSQAKAAGSTESAPTKVYYVKSRRRRWVRILKKTLAAIAIYAGLAAPAAAGEWRLALHGLSHHFDDPGDAAREANPGLGLLYLEEHMLAGTGAYRNSLDRTSVYAGLGAERCLGAACAGAWVLAVSGYQSGPRPALVPFLRLHQAHWGAELLLMPPAEPGGSGALALSLEIGLP